MCQLLAEPEPIPFVRTVIASDSPHGPCGNALGDLDGDGQLDAIVAGSEGPLVWYAYPDWSRSVLAAQGYPQKAGWRSEIWTGMVTSTSPWAPPGSRTLVCRPAILDRPGLPIGSAPVAAIGRGPRRPRPGREARRRARGGTGSPVTLFKQNGPRSWLRRNLAPGAGTQGLALADVNQDGSRHRLGGTMAEESAGQDPLPAVATAQLRLLEPGGGLGCRRSEPGWPAWTS